MENASKALLMAGALLISMLLIALLLYAWNLFSKYYASQDELASIENVAEFNLQFTAYDRDDVAGYELLSLLNRVIDYNQRYSVEGKNEKNFTPIKITINFYDRSYKGNKLKKQDVENALSMGSLKLFTSKSYTQSTTMHIWGTSIIKSVSDLENKYGKKNIDNLSKEVDTLYIAGDFGGSVENEISGKKEVVSKFVSMISSGEASDDMKIIYEKIKENYNKNTPASIRQAYNAIVKDSFKTDVYKYYEYVQFKKALFICESESIIYDEVSGKVSEMIFDFTGKII